MSNQANKEWATTVGTVSSQGHSQGTRNTGDADDWTG